MKRFMYIVVAAFLFVLLGGQPVAAQSHLSKKELRKMEKKKKKEAREKESAAMRAKYRNLLENKHFVFEAQKVYLPASGHTTVETNLNFIAVKDDRILVQFKFPGLGGPNGLDGVTVRGKLENWVFDPGKNSKQAMTVSGQVTPLGTSNRIVFTITVSNDGFADAQINLRNSSFRMTGMLYSLEDADVVVGNTNF